MVSVAVPGCWPGAHGAKLRQARAATNMATARNLAFIGRFSVSGKMS